MPTVTSKPSTMRDVAELAGVSVSTVSNVVNQRTREMSPETHHRVLSAARALKFHPNSSGRALRAKRSQTLGFLILDPERQFLADPMTDMIIAGIGDVVRDRGYSLLIHSGRPDVKEEELLQAVMQQRVDGVFLMLSGSRAHRRWYVDRALEHGTHVMLFERDSRGMVPSVTADNKGAAVGLVDHLVARGHRRIAFIASKVSWPMVEERFAGYRAALRRAAIERDKQLEVFDGAWTPQNGGDIARHLMALSRPPTAIMAGNDLLALGVIHALGDLGLNVPDDVAVTGFDDFSFAAYTKPSLTTASVPGYEMGLRAATDLIDTLQRPEPSEHRNCVLPVELRLRDSA